MPASPKYRHSVYVIELDDKVLNHRRFRQANPGYDPTKSCLYVGCTGLKVEQRFANHKRGYKGNSYVRDYGLRLRPELYACFNPMPYQAALTMERELAEELRDKGHAVWQA
jgi:predicted GIY-YIG superfamily endonuclease